MRPLKLTMQAFGAFPNKIEIPFENLGKNNIFLISGVTGSGKTTIFDAICYALFNASSGENRGATTLRSHFVKDDVESYVEFSFLFNDEKYIILRHPSYERKKSRGDGFIQEQAKAQITLPNGKIIEKPKEVGDFIKELLGLNVAQFSQIALLAQGEFLKLLNADTQTRADIFRNIFKTWDYSNFQEKLKKETNEIKTKLDELNSSILQYIFDISPLEEELKNIKNDFIKNNCFNNLDNFIILLENQNSKDESALNFAKVQMQKIEKETKILQEEFLKTKNKINLKNQKDELKKILKNSENDFKTIEKEYKNLENKRKTLQEILLQIKKTDEDYKKSLEIKELIKEKNNLQKTFEFNLEIQKNFKKQTIEIKKNYLSHLNFLMIKLENELKTKQNEFLTLQKEVDNLSKNYLKNYNEYLNIQAGIIAKNLIDNKPCPVCGSLIHPNPAKNLNENLTKDFLDKLKNNLDDKNKILSNLAQNCSILKEQNKIQKDLYNKLLKQFEINNEIKSIEFSNINFEDELLKNEEQIKAIENKINQNSADIKVIESQIETLLKNITSCDLDNILILYKNLTNEAQNLEKEIIASEKNYNNQKILIEKQVSQIHLLDLQLKELSEIKLENIDEISKNIEKLSQETINLDNSIKEILVRFSINSKNLESIKSKNKEYTNLSKLYSDYKILSDCANGTLKGCAKMTFEQYIQGYYLDMVLFEANKHLKVMTNNQFQLLRKQNITTHQTKTALDLEVMDFHTFKKRSTKTLSGGESFKAALSLALGLCDCISNNSGAINIEAMFIDEGFGTLDNESLELAMDVIFNLSNNNRLIGLISHVEDLKSKIQNQIIALKTDSGSSLEMNF